MQAESAVKGALRPSERGFELGLSRQAFASRTRAAIDVVGIGNRHPGRGQQATDAQ